jgi:hypothetical protein
MLLKNVRKIVDQKIENSSGGPGLLDEPGRRIAGRLRR